MDILASLNRFESETKVMNIIRRLMLLSTALRHADAVLMCEKLDTILLEFSDDVGQRTAYGHKRRDYEKVFEAGETSNDAK